MPISFVGWMLVFGASIHIAGYQPLAVAVLAADRTDLCLEACAHRRTMPLTGPQAYMALSQDLLLMTIFWCSAGGNVCPAA